MPARFQLDSSAKRIEITEIIIYFSQVVEVVKIIGNHTKTFCNTDARASSKREQIIFILLYKKKIAVN